jgi:3-dehydroquinate synthase
MKKITAKAGSTTYDIITGRPLSQFPAAFGRLAQKGAKVAIVSDEAVTLRHGVPLAATLCRLGYDAFALGVPAGETSKNLRQAEKLYRFCALKKMERKSWVIALGGGVVGDLAGFIAATFLRGVSFVQIPTTLLAQVDSSIGGKTGVDIPQGKNLVGVFYQPKLVWIDPELLRTLPKEHLRNGMAEVIKYGAILDEKLFATLEKKAETLLQGFSDEWTPIIARCAELKARVVEEDPHETSGRRALLNFGHTIGHAIEAATGYRGYLHGEAVSIGMFAASIISQQQDLLDQVDRIRLGTLLSKVDLPIAARSPIPRKKLMEYLSRDKKSDNGVVRFVLLEQIGKAVSGQTVSPEVLEVALTTVGL